MNKVRNLLLALMLGTSLIGSAALAAEGSGPSYVRLRPISFSVIGPSNKIDKEVSLSLVLELEGGKTEAQFDPFRRQVLDSFLVALNELYDSQKPGDPPVPGEAIKDKLLEVASEITGPGLIKSVLILSVGERTHGR
ncbi:MAG TPA: hypothetical protein VM689_07960 [Aliidongia sp.]|nr:hypothetical protein [Aliidongia sp.]